MVNPVELWYVIPDLISVSSLSSNVGNGQALDKIVKTAIDYHCVISYWNK